MNRYPARQEPRPQGDTAPRPAPYPRTRRAAARHRKGPRSRWLVAGLALASVLTATVITATVDPAAPSPSPSPDGKASLQSAH
ncbi:MULTISPECIES: hypothetical protein [unclassified Streptomyces]|uniref:hypothetical protein n=1 Tax=unclassified Streptomyces TaxID=2593676 RepID=UPI002E0EBA52|nr:hypothetical protein OG299_03190 [Streptomyces sp. NBC_01296]